MKQSNRLSVTTISSLLMVGLAGCRASGSTNQRPQITQPPPQTQQPAQGSPDFAPKVNYRYVPSESERQRPLTPILAAEGNRFQVDYRWIGLGRLATVMKW